MNYYYKYDVDADQYAIYTPYDILIAYVNSFEEAESLLSHLNH